MFKNALFAFMSGLFLLLFSCQPKLLKQGPSAAEPDSVLFYQKKDVHDPFLDALLAQPHETVVLHKTIIFPPSAKTEYKKVPGYRVQIFASGDSSTAILQKEKVVHIIKDTCLIIHQNHLFKVQVGNFQKRIQADSLKLRLKKLGFTGSWVVQTQITVPVVSTDSVSADSTVSNRLPRSAPQLSPFRIQIFATKDRTKALQISHAIAQKLGLSCNIQKQADLYKVYVSGFNTRSQAETALRKIKQFGYKDAWIVHQ